MIDGWALCRGLGNLCRFAQPLFICEQGAALPTDITMGGCAHRIHAHGINLMLRTGEGNRDSVDDKTGTWRGRRYVPTFEVWTLAMAGVSKIVTVVSYTFLNPI